MAQDIFIRFSGIKGESQDFAHKGDIDVLRWAWAARQPANMHSGSGGGDFYFDHFIDQSSGAHFLIDRDGTIYQTASLFKVTWHVGRLQSRCYLTKKCEPADLQKVTELEKSWRNYDKVHQIEKVKNYPDRFPSNVDSIGIEIVGKAERVTDKKTGDPIFVYEEVSNQQNDSLKWLIGELVGTLNVSTTEIYRHPEIGRKNLTEASSAKW